MYTQSFNVPDAPGGKTVLLTGAGGGIGRCMALLLASPLASSC